MTEELYTIADGVDDPATRRDRALLVVYHEEEARTRAIEIADGAEVTFGRTRTATVFIDSEKVSRLHARIRRTSSTITIEDLGSRNGTRINGKKIAQPTALTSGDEIAVGPTTAVISVTSRAARRVPVGSSSYLEERLAAEVDRSRAYQRPLALLMLRLEGSPEATDAALARISAQLRLMDVLAEYGPDELGILLPELARGDAEIAAHRIVRAAGSHEIGAAAVVGIRAGLALLPDHAVHAGELLSRARSALRAARVNRQFDGVAAPPADSGPVSTEVIVGDPQMRRVLALAHKVADHPITVLITGETGVGKEVVAEEIHRASPRREGPFLKLNCASIPESLLESELFGYERGAFTGADRQKRGYFEAADGGTIFLDEIGEVSSGIQSKLLRVLEERRLTRVGSTSEISVDVRVVCATNRDLEAEVAAGRFREDLFFRISAFTIVVPPLRDRPAEIRLLAEHFARDAARELGAPAPSLSAGACDALERHDWPGNVRELRNAIERAVVMQSGGVIQPEDLPERVRDQARSRGPMAVVPTGGARSVDDEIAAVERAALIAALDACAGNQTHAARRLGVSRRALIYRMEKHGLKPPPGKRD